GNVRLIFTKGALKEGNVRLIFTKGALKEVREETSKYKVCCFFD
ncbi:60S acidic ribosomal protein P0, partial [Bienertia sinuspersici]